MQISILSTVIIFKTSQSPSPDLFRCVYCWRNPLFQEMVLEEELMYEFCQWPASKSQKSWYILWLSIPNFYGNISVFGLGVGQELRRRTDIGKWIYPLSRCERVSKLLKCRINISNHLLAENLLHLWNADSLTQRIYIFKIMKYVVVDIFVT